MNGEPIVRLGARAEDHHSDTVKMRGLPRRDATGQPGRAVAPLSTRRRPESSCVRCSSCRRTSPNYERGELVVRLHSMTTSARQSRPGLTLRRAQRVGRLLPRHRTQAGAGGHTSGNRVAIIIGVCPGNSEYRLSSRHPLSVVALLWRSALIAAGGPTSCLLRLAMGRQRQRSDHLRGGQEARHCARGS